MNAPDATATPQFAGSATPMPSFVTSAPAIHVRARLAARWIGITAFLVYAISGGGRIVGSDEVTMLELARAMLHGGIAVPVGATLDGPDGRHYTKNAAGQAVLALPLVAVAEVAEGRLPLPVARRVLAARCVVSFFNAAITALLLAVFYRFVRFMGVRARPALAATVMLGFTTPVWAYAKSFMAEPLQALGLLFALEGGARVANGEGRLGWIAALGVLIAVSVKFAMLPLAIVCLLPLARARWTAWIAPAIGLAVALAGHAIYDVMRFGTPFETGYGRQASAAAFTTPILTGLYGLLASSGKGVIWFAPAILLAIPGAIAMRRAGAAEARTATAAIAAFALAVLGYSMFEHWAGDGSFGPRYLVPLLPLVFVPVAFALNARRALTRAAAVLLAIAGCAVAIGGVGIYFGAEMREVGDYPYTRALNDPLFMHESHFVPARSPILGHWRMLIRNAREHIAHRAPRLTTRGAVDPRTGLTPDDQRALLHGLDFWWTYAPEVGVPLVPVAAALALLLLLAAWAGLQMLAFVAEDAA
ncbi:MAG: hypothetical protein HY240_06950 [Actinobacteria bacterium]|uniref:Uncharacterized protein n=1 Tax=Eiseniibacteriota bacterium TaxID=2212470 RepID=A0A9D6LCC8_UNCEI|nr:hypothetical protein [Candidatus Eisenbacteria bacterium]MBI3540513.1 hypothetical protein [Candidatus Eisenbacteria bacterium]MBI3648466.1 hypothetical protein [Actinomycetota bacterium]